MTGTPLFATEATSIRNDLVALCRELHAHPEVGLDLPGTCHRIVQALEPAGLDIRPGASVSSVTAVLHGALPGPTVLLRADMDALPIAEQTEVDFASVNGAMHACGHDLHMAGLVGAAMLLSAHRESLAGSVVFMFQPGEEGWGGAQLMIQHGLLTITGELPVAAYGIHVVPGESGTFSVRAGAAASGSNRLTITVRGKGGHGSQPHLACDPVPVAAEIVLALQTLVTRRFNVFDPVVVSVTQLQAGEAINAIPDVATLRATVRTLSAESLRQLQDEIPALVEHIAAAHGCQGDTDFRVLYPVTVNSADESERVLTTLRGQFGAARVQEAPRPWMASEDFSFVLERVPGALILLGATPPGIDADAVEMNHSPRALFNDAILADQAAALAALAWNRLESERHHPSNP